MIVEFILKNGCKYKTIDPVIDFKIINLDQILVLEFEFKFERYVIKDYSKILINGKDLKEYEKEKGKAQ